MTTSHAERHSRRGQRRSLWGAHGDRLAFFASSVQPRRVRRTTDALLVVWAALLVWLLCVVSTPPSGFEKAVMGVVDAVPGFLAIVWRLGTGSLVVWVAVLVVATMTRRRLAVMVDIAASLCVAGAIGMILAERLNGEWPTLSQAVTGGSTSLVPAVGLGAAIAVAAAVAPQLTRPFRVAGWSIVLFGASSAVMLGSTSPTGAGIALGIGVLGAAAVHLALGTEAGHASDAEVLGALEDLGVPVAELLARPRPTAGVFTLDGADSDGRPLVVRVYGRDARDTQIVAKLWRSLAYREAAVPTLTRLQQVEHEGFVTLLAASRGVRVPEVLAAGHTGAGDALIVLSGGGTTLSGLEPATAGVLDDLWALLASLHSSGLALGAIEPETFSVDGGGALQFTDLRHAVAAPTEDQLAIDRAQLMVVTALMGGTDPAVAAACRALGPDGLATILPYLQPAALSRGVRHSLKEQADSDIDGMRTAASAAAGVEPPQIAKLRRVSKATLLRVGLLSLIAFALITTLGGVSIDELRAELSGAVWGWVVAGVVIGQIPFLTQAVVTRAACPRPVAYGPVAMLQFAIGFINLAIPSSAARVALDVRFFQRQGVPPAAAVSVAAIDGFSGFLVQISLLVATLVFGLGQVNLTFDLPSSGSGSSNLVWIVGIGLGLVVVAVILAVSVPRVRRRIVERVRPLVGQIRDTLRSLRSPAKLLQIFGGSIANQVLFALTLGACLSAFGGHLNLATLMVIYVAAALFGGMMPVPGGIGVMEAALITGMVAADVSETTASAAAITFRLITFYLPPVWGWFAFNWLQRKSYL